MKSYRFISLFLLVCVSLAWGQNPLPAIRFTAQPPFDAQGRHLQKTWAQADKFVRFLTKDRQDRLNPALYDAEGAALFDETNLYIHARGYDDPQGKQSAPDANIFKNNNFEIFIQVTPDRYFQIVADDTGKTRTGIGRDAVPLPQVSIRTFRQHGHWDLNLTIPFSTLGIPAPTANRTIKLAFMRQNISTWNPREPELSFYQEITQSYHNPKEYAEAVLTRTPGKPRQVTSQVRHARFNLIPNPEFDKPGSKRRIEAAELSNQWIIRGTSQDYLFYEIQPVEFEADTLYTLQVKARRFGDSGSLSILQIKQAKDGSRYGGEGTYVTYNRPLTRDFHVYNFPFKPQGKPSVLTFYVRDAKPGSGIDLDYVKLFKGNISGIEIRSYIPRAVTRPAAGTVPPPPPANVFGKTGGRPLRVLVLTNDFHRTCESREIFSGLNVQCDTLITTGVKQDIYNTLDQPKIIEQRLKDGGYDLYMLGSNVAPRVGEGLYGKIAQHVRQGAGLWCGFTNQNEGLFAPLLKQANLTTVQPNSHWLQGFPEGLFRTPKNKPIQKAIRTGRVGKGQILKITDGLKWPLQDFQVQIDLEDYGVTEFPYLSYTNAWIARLAHLLAGKIHYPIESVSIHGNDLKVKVSKVPAGATLSWKIIDKNGFTKARGNANVIGGMVSDTLPDVPTTGTHALVTHLRNAQKQVLDYSLNVFHRPGPALNNLKADKTSYLSSDTASFTTDITDLKPGLTLTWALMDFSGRILEAGSHDAQAQNNFKVPLNALYTNMGRLCVTLSRKGQEMDRTYAAVYVRDLDRKRLLDDFTPAIWNSGNHNIGSLRTIDRQLEKVGIRLYHHSAWYAPPYAMCDGMAMGGTILGRGDVWFNRSCANHVRIQPYCTDEARKLFKKNGQNADLMARYGVIFNTVTDEFCMAMPDSKDEPDANPVNVAVFRQRMKEQYHTIQNYNQRHQTAYRNFDELGPTLVKQARDAKKYAEFIEWRNFNVDRFYEAVEIIGKVAKETCPEAELMLPNTFGQTALSGNDYWKYLTRTKNYKLGQEYMTGVTFSQNPIYIFDEFYRSFRPDLRVWGWVGYSYATLNSAQFMPWWYAAHRYGGFSWFASWYPQLNMVTLPSLALTEEAMTLKKTLDGVLMNGIGKVFLDYQWRKNDVAIYYSHNSLLLAYALGKEDYNRTINPGSWLHQYYYGRQGIQFMLEELLWQYDFVAPQQIINHKLDAYKILFMPTIIALSDEEIKALKEFQSRGGIIVADNQPGTFDELGVKRTQPPFTEKEVTLFPNIFNEKDKSQKTAVRNLLKQAGAKPILESHDIVDFSGREAMHFRKGDMNIYAILRTVDRSKDHGSQTFKLPQKAHLYDIKNARYLGETDTFTAKVPYADALVFGHYPYKVEGIDLDMPEALHPGEDLNVAMDIRTNGFWFLRKSPQHHVFHIEVKPPQQQARFHMKRNVSAEHGHYDFRFRMAHNDPKGTWTLTVTDAMTGTVCRKTFQLK